MQVDRDYFNKLHNEAGDVMRIMKNADLSLTFGKYKDITPEEVTVQIKSQKGLSEIDRVFHRGFQYVENMPVIPGIVRYFTPWEKAAYITRYAIALRDAHDNKNNENLHTTSGHEVFPVTTGTNFRLSSHEPVSVMISRFEQGLIDAQTRADRPFGNIAIFGGSACGKDYFIAKLLEAYNYDVPTVAPRFIDVSMGTFFRNISRGFLLHMHNAGIINLYQHESVNKFLSDLSCRSYLNEFIEGFDQTYQNHPVIPVVTFNEKHSRYRIIAENHHTSDEVLWQAGAAFEDRIVSDVAKYQTMQLRAIEYARRAQTTVHQDEKLNSTMVVIQGRKFTLQLIGQFDFVVEIYNDNHQQVGIRRLIDTIKRYGNGQITPEATQQALQQQFDIIAKYETELGLYR
jgi:hypothetical protein